MKEYRRIEYKWVKVFIAGLVVCGVLAYLAAYYHVPTGFTAKTYETNYLVTEYYYSAIGNFIVLASIWFSGLFTLFLCSKDVDRWLRG